MRPWYSSRAEKALPTVPGIPAHLHADVFQEYRQLVGDDRVARVGLGLGLAIAKRISILLDHSDRAAFDRRRGSDFSISCPIGRPNRVETRRAPAVQANASSFAGKLVCCVEDEPEVLSGLEALLMSWGCRTQGYNDVAVALSGASRHAYPPDLLIVDYHLDDHHKGLEVAQQLKAIWQKNVPVIVVTAADLRDHQVRHEDGIVRIIRKPLRPGALRALMDVVLG